MAASLYERARARMDNGWSRVRNVLGKNDNVQRGPNVTVHRRTAKDFVGVISPDGRAIVGTRRSRVHIFDDQGKLLMRSKLSKLHQERRYTKLANGVVYDLLRVNTVEQALNLHPAVITDRIISYNERNPGPHSPMTLGRGRTPYSFDGPQRG